MSRYLQIMGFAMLFSAPEQVLAQKPPVVHSIEITSTFKERGGLVHRVAQGSSGTEASSTEIAIYKEGNAYHMHDKALDSNSARADWVVDGALIVALAKALTAPARAEANLDDLGVTPAWLKAHASGAAQHFAGTRINGAPVHLAMLEAAFADPAEADQAVPVLFDSRHYSCADCPRPDRYVEIVVTFDNAPSVKARSGSQFPFMLPWRVFGNSPGSVAFNADISRALAALLPENATNRAQLAGENLDIALGNVLLWRVEHQAQLSDVESKTGGTFGALRTKYNIQSASIGNFRDSVVRNPELTASGAAEETTLLLHLQALDPPHNFFEDEVILGFVDGKVVGTDEFLKTAPQFEKLVLSVPWLNQYVQEHPGGPYRLSYVRDASFSDEAMRAFTADMRAIGKNKLIPKVEAVKDRIGLLVVGAGADESDWLVLPDREMVLWRYWQTPVAGSKPRLLKWSDSPLYKKPCAKLPSNFVGCVGAEISPDGTLRPLE
jgi:hypothetical protein